MIGTVRGGRTVLFFCFFTVFLIFFLLQFPFFVFFNLYYYVKKIKFLLLMSILSVELCVRPCELFCAENAQESFHMFFYADSKKTAGIKINIPALELRFSERESEFYNFGLGLYSKKLVPAMPVTVKAGNLSTGGMLSYLKNPELSFGTSPFTMNTFSPCVITASLPGYSSFSKPQSVFVQAEAKFSSAVNLIVNSVITPDAPEPVFSAQVSTALFRKKLKFYLSFTGGEFFYDEKESSSWFFDNVYYAGGRHFCSINQLCAEYKNNNSQFEFFADLAVGIYETPFSLYFTNYRAELKIHTRHTELYTGAFYNPKDELITSNDKSLPSSVQFKQALVIKTLAGRKRGSPFVIKGGANALCKIKLLTAQYSAAANLGMQISSARTSVSFTGSAKIENDVLDSVSLQFKNFWYFNKINLGGTVSASLLDSKYKLVISTSTTGKAMGSGKQSDYLKGKTTISGNTGFSFSIKDGIFLPSKLTGTISLNQKMRLFTLTLKASADIPL